MRAVMWQKGQSGNPSGRKAEYFEMQRMCREASPAAAQRLIEMAYLDVVDENGNLAPLPVTADRRIVSWAVGWFGQIVALLFPLYNRRRSSHHKRQGDHRSSSRSFVSKFSA